MKRLLMGGTAALALSVGTAFAGGLAEPVLAPAIVEAASTASSSGILVPVVLILLIAAAVALGGGETVAVSDQRIKTDLKWVGLTQDSIPVYQYRYVGLSTRFEGVMAQDVAARRPDAVIMPANGPMAVDYKKLGHSLRVLH